MASHDGRVLPLCSVLRSRASGPGAGAGAATPSVGRARALARFSRKSNIDGLAAMLASVLDLSVVAFDFITVFDELRVVSVRGRTIGGGAVTGTGHHGESGAVARASAALARLKREMGLRGKACGLPATIRGRGLSRA